MTERATARALTGLANIIQDLDTVAKSEDTGARWIGATAMRAKAEIERLQAAKRAALAIADERSKENVALRAALQEAADARSFGDALDIISNALRPQTGDPEQSSGDATG